MTQDGLQGLKLLYVEDDESIRNALVRFLSRRTKLLFVAEDGEEGLRLFKEHSPDLVVTDIQMPKMNGLTMSEKIREIDSEVPIVIITAFNEEGYLMKAIDLGIDKFIKKPVDNGVLLNTLKKVARVVVQQKKIENKNRFINQVLDNICQFVMIVKDGEVAYMNLQFLTYVGSPDIEAFKVRGGFKNILVVKEDSFYKDKTLQQWVEEVLHNKEHQYVVYMQTDRGVNSFIARASQTNNEDGILVTFSDVTDLEREKEHFTELATTDPLTGIYNRKKFNDELEKEIERVKRYRTKLSLIFFDIDHFKRVNDTYGHPVGDTVIQTIAKIVSADTRKGDIFARYGGEEFVILVPENDDGGAFALAEKLRAKIEAHNFSGVGRVTCSFGVADYKEGKDGADLIKRADKALYTAKNSGRNCVKKDS